jgi:hypothetical protein
VMVRAQARLKGGPEKPRPTSQDHTHDQSI